jgi:hypothetical protein
MKLINNILWALFLFTGYLLAAVLCFNIAIWFLVNEEKDFLNYLSRQDHLLTSILYGIGGIWIIISMALHVTELHSKNKEL